MAPAGPHRQIALSTSLLAEAMIGITVVAVLGVRRDLHDFAVVLPVCVVAGGVGLLAFGTRSRFLFWCGLVGATAGVAFPKPRFHVSFSPDADPADVAVIWSGMVGEINFQYALVGSIVGIAIGYGVVHFLRNYANHKDKKGVRS